MEESVFAEWVAELRAAIEEIRGDSEMNDTEWEIRPSSPKPPPPIGIQTVYYGARGTVARNGTVCLWDDDTDENIVGCVEIRWLIASLQSILVLAEEHFGEDWGK